MHTFCFSHDITITKLTATVLYSLNKNVIETGYLLKIHIYSLLTFKIPLTQLRPMAVPSSRAIWLWIKFCFILW